ncbi:hypothetical protein R3W88_034030 [Solanum pinnatisectum]|uniref:Aspartic peptidase DDI1-type domain-containing protein n=2 Tax=Solanum pinnatisectum TaxID=50273 RepID=A0AAV9JZ99_9SOLN|nr:hypothetical protein R3W88_034030 [Solanum pinnatisectum]
MAVTTRRGKQTIDPPMPCEVEIVVEKDANEIEVTRELKNGTEKEEEVTQKVVSLKIPKFITMLKQLSVNVPLIEALEKIPGYAKFIKDLVTKKCAICFENDERLLHCSAIAIRSLVQKKQDPGACTIPCTIEVIHFANALCDLGATINLMPFSIYKKLSLGAQKQTAMRLLIADRTVKRPIGVLQDVLVKVESFIFPTDFVILDCKVDYEVPIILGRPFLATMRALVDMERGLIQL